MFKNSDNFKSNFNSALILYKNGKLNEAKSICEKILKKKTGNYDTLYLLSIINFQQKNI